MVAPPTDESVGGGIEGLLRVLELEPQGEDRFSAPGVEIGPRHRIYGGQVAAQALRAAALTVKAEQHPHSLHCYFLREGRPEKPLLLAVQRFRDGRSFTTRSVVALQDDEAIFALAASFHRREEGLEYQIPMAEGVPGPDDSPSRYRGVRHGFPLDIREPAPAPGDADPPPYRSWVRTLGKLPDDPLVHACALAYLSDVGSPFASLMERSVAEGVRFFGASLDHAVWFHRPVRADEWLLLDLTPRAAAGARTLYYGTIHTRSGLLGASIAQEALLRVPGPG